MRLLRHPVLWFAAFAVWFGVLWWLSSAERTFPDALQFRASDKLLHFGYFLGGSGLLSAALFTWKPAMPSRRRLIACAVVVILVGALDEFHQSFVPNRQGNDPADLLADALGAIAGALVFHPCRRLLGRGHAHRHPLADRRRPSSTDS